MAWMLEFTVVLELLLGRYREAGIIATLLVFNAAVGLIRETRTQSALSLLRQQLEIQTRCVTRRPMATRAGEGLRERSLYQCRHTFATIALSAGEEIGWVARQMRHESTEMVVRHYYRWIRNSTRQDGAALDRLLQKHGLDR